MNGYRQKLYHYGLSKLSGTQQSSANIFFKSETASNVGKIINIKHLLKTKKERLLIPYDGKIKP